ncbi:uncharacterized protein C8Q71DRAFT_763180 [Rhodofomes roseus]|uniref:Uncharacterized protein n=1 Tax=Rhodofomes roseus TaxID=34475 RepID=A0A4Y9YD06_9APHY|nr:uncharacterized protein C8Q71DRAFT_763180 [Rhodofomes roseus]KAH9835726.1 hypothetical protein C8Q71DRAFT_763180 [Rhodofomes roseus]TFY59447.1 hypothetical protein EVJ58_g5768 [Rhodofomes roseus]
MRSPLLAFSLVAAAVSPSLAASHPNSPKFGRSVTHPRVTEVQNPGAESLHLKRSGLNGLGLNKLEGSGANPVDMILPQGAAAAPPSKAGASKADAGSNDNFDPFAGGEDPNLPVDPSDVPDPSTIPASELDNVPVTPATPAEPAQPANPNGNGQQDPASDGSRGRHAPNRAEIEKMFGSGGEW